MTTTNSHSRLGASVVRWQSSAVESSLSVVPPVMEGVHRNVQLLQARTRRELVAGRIDQFDVRFDEVLVQNATYARQYAGPFPQDVDPRGIGIVCPNRDAATLGRWWRTIVEHVPGTMYPRTGMMEVRARAAENVDGTAHGFGGWTFPQDGEQDVSAW